MSGMEKEELADRIRATTGEEQVIIARILDDKVLWEELQRRYSTQHEMLIRIKGIVREGKE